MNRQREEISSDPLDTREIIFTSLLLLGFDPREMEDTYKIPFTRNMFSVPNKKGFEVVMNFLFERLNPALAHERFRNCWPIFDKKQEQGFRKTISNWLTEISKEDPDAKLPRIVPSLFMSPGGDRFYTLLFYFSHYVVLKTCKLNHGVKSRDLLQPTTITATNKQFAPVMGKTIQASTMAPRKRFLEGTQQLIGLQGEWKKFASSLVKEYRSLCKKIRDLEHKVRGQESRMIAHTEVVGGTPNIRLRASGMTEGEWEVLAVKRAQLIQKVRDLWRSVEDCHQAQAHERAVVASILSEGGRKDRLDADDIPVQIPELLLKECERDIQQRRINNVYVGGKLDLVSLIKLWNLALRLYLGKLNEAPLPDFERSAPSTAVQLHTHNAHLVNTRALRHSLSDELLPDLERSISQLLRFRKEGIEIPTRDTLVEASPGHFLGPGVGLIPPTPPVSFDPAATPKGTAAGMRTVPSRFRKSPAEVSTPETMSKVRETVHKTAMKKVGLAQGTPASTLKDIRVPTPQSKQKTQKPSRLKAPSRQRNRSAVATHRPPATQETPVSARRPAVDGSSRLSASRRMVQTTGKKKGKKPPAFQRPTETAKKKRGTKGLGQFDHEPSSRDEATMDRLEPHTMAAERARNMLIDQIVDSVVGSSPERSTGTLTPDIPDREEASPALLALKDPLGGLGLDAFVSREKLQHSPLVDEEEPSDAPSSQASLQQEGSTGSPSEESSSTLLASTQHGESQQLSTPSGATNTLPTDLKDSSSKVESKARDVNPEYAEWNATLQRMSTSLMTPPSPPIGHGPPTGAADSLDSARHLRDKIIEQDLLQFVEPDVSRGRGSPVGGDAGDGSTGPPDLLVVDDLLSPSSLDPNHSGEEIKEIDARSYPTTFRSPELGLDADLSGNEGQQDLSVWHLDEEFREVFQSRTPQLPERLRNKSVKAGGQESPHASSSGASSETPSMGTRPFRTAERMIASTSAHGEHPEARRLNMTSSTEEEDSTSKSDVRDKIRFRSGSSQKSVTFSEPLAEEVRDENGLELSERTQSIAEETLPDMDEEDQFSSPEGYETAPRTLSPFDSCSPRGGRSSVVGEEYLVSSPRPPQCEVKSPDMFSIDLESPESEGISFSMTRPIEDLLEQVSPTITPSKTPQLRTRVAQGTQNGSERATPDHTPELPTRTRRGGINVDNTPTGPPRQDTSLSQRMASVRLASGSLGVNGTPQHRFNKALKTPADFSILEEEESILIPTSPVQ